MFSHKPAPPKTPWAVRVLTPDFLVDGYTDTDAHPDSWPFFGPQTGRLEAIFLWLSSPRFTPTSAASGAPPNVSAWLVPYTGDLVAVLPFDDASLAAMQKNAADAKHAFAAVLLAGPYLIRGQLLSLYEKPDDIAVMSGHHSLAVANAEIEYRLPGAQFTGLKSPLMIVHTRHMQGLALTG